MKNYLILLTALFYSCSSSQLVGRYSSKDKTSYIEIKADSTFFYRNAVFHANKTSAGNWNIFNKNTLMFKSDFSDSIISVNVKEETQTEKESNMLLNFHIKNGQPLGNYNCQIFINDTPYFRDDVVIGRRCDSLNKIVFSEQIENLYFVFSKNPSQNTTEITFPLKTTIYRPLNKGNLKLKIDVYFNDSIFNLKAFNDEKVLIKRNKIKIYDHERGSWRCFKNLQTTNRAS